MALGALLTVAFAGSLVYGRVRGGEHRSARRTVPRAFAAFGALLLVAGLTAAVLVVLPTVRDDADRRDDREVCAREAGYASPADDNSVIATAESQAVFRDCLARRS